VFRPIETDPPAGQVQRVTFVPFLPDGRCVLIERPEGPGLPAGEVLDGEDYLIDTVLRVPLQTAGFRYQHVRPFGIDGGHLYAWIEGTPYRGDRPHTAAELSFCTAERAASRLRASRSWPRRLPRTGHWTNGPFTPVPCAPWSVPACAARLPRKAPGSAAADKRGGRPAIASPRRSPRPGHSWTPAARTAC